MKRYEGLQKRIEEMDEQHAKYLLKRVFANIQDLEILGENEAFNQIKNIYKENILMKTNDMSKQF